jgi:hypothetical protein
MVLSSNARLDRRDVDFLDLRPAWPFPPGKCFSVRSIFGAANGRSFNSRWGKGGLTKKVAQGRA